MWKRSLTIVSWNAAYKDIRWSRFIKAEEAGYMFFGAVKWHCAGKWGIRLKQYGVQRMRKGSLERIKGMGYVIS